MPDKTAELQDFAAHPPAPYWYHKGDDLPGVDFNREIIEPGTNETFPAGAVGIRCDGDFWAVAALPLRFRTLDARAIVAVLWPTIYLEAEFSPDSEEHSEEPDEEPTPPLPANA